MTAPANYNISAADETLTSSSITREIERKVADDGIPVKRADNVVVGDVLVLDWPAWGPAKVVNAYSHPFGGEAKGYVRFEVMPLDTEGYPGQFAFVFRGWFEYVRVMDRPRRPLA